MSSSRTAQQAAILPLSDHARKRLAQRGLGTDAVEAAFDYGREAFVRKAHFFVLGRNEVEHARRLGVDISEHEGVHVVCASDGTVVTVYRCRQLQLRPSRKWSGRRRQHRRHAG